MKTFLLWDSSFCPNRCVPGVSVSGRGCEKFIKAGSKSSRCLGLDRLGGSGDSSPSPWEGFPGARGDAIGRFEKVYFRGARGSALDRGTVDPKSCYQESQLRTGVGSERNRQWWCVWVGAHVCLTENILLWKESDWKCQLKWLKNTHYGGLAPDTSFIYLLNLELTHSSSWVPLSMHEIQQNKAGGHQSSQWGHRNGGCTLGKGKELIRSAPSRTGQVKQVDMGRDRTSTLAKLRHWPHGPCLLLASAQSSSMDPIREALTSRTCALSGPGEGAQGQSLSDILCSFCPDMEVFLNALLTLHFVILFMPSVPVCHLWLLES